MIVPAQVLFLHPTYNIVLLQYDPELLGETKVSSATLYQPKEDALKFNLPKKGESCLLMILGDDSTPMIRETKISNVTELYSSQSVPPKFRATNVEKIEVETPLYGKGNKIWFLPEISCLMTAD